MRVSKTKTKEQRRPVSATWLKVGEGLARKMRWQFYPCESKEPLKQIAAHLSRPRCMALVVQPCLRSCTSTVHRSSGVALWNTTLRHLSYHRRTTFAGTLYNILRFTPLYNTRHIDESITVLLIEFFLSLTHCFRASSSVWCSCRVAVMVVGDEEKNSSFLRLIMHFRPYNSIIAWTSSISSTSFGPPHRHIVTM